MASVSIPYDRTKLTAEIEDGRLIGTAVSELAAMKPSKSQSEIASGALDAPIGSEKLSELAKGKKTVTVITSDHTRAVPSGITMPLILEEIRKGSPEADIRILIATGLHRPTTDEEILKRFGEEIVSKEKIYVNDAYDPSLFEDLGNLSSGRCLHVNKLALDCDLLVCEGFIEPHFFAGFSGGRKSILPGVCDKDTVNQNHCFAAIADPKAVTGVLEGNPIHEDMLEAAKKVKVDFILNVALNEKKEIVAAFAGNLEKAHAEGVEFVSRYSKVETEAADIVITGNGGYPLDQNLYQSVKAAATAAACCTEGGVIILCCACSDGIGGEYFEKLATMGSPKEILDYMESLGSDTIPEQWNEQVYAKVMMEHPVILVSELDAETVKRFNLIPAASLDEALAIAEGIKGSSASILAIPDGVTVFA